MYGSDEGPIGATEGPSYVHTNVDVTAIPMGEPSANLKAKVMFYRSMILIFNTESNLNLCPDDVVTPETIMDLDVRSFDMTKTEENGVQSYSAKVEARHNVDESGLQHMMIQVCPNEVNIKTFSVEGELTFHNPYGFLPGMDYGCLPFELFRVLALLSLGAFFSLVMWFNRSTLLPVHKMIIGVVALGTVEACCWLVAYSYMNSTGKPFCCPYPGTVILAMAMMLLRQTVSRFLLLVICLGYGITRVELEKREVVFIVALTIAYLASGILQLASSVSYAAHIRSGQRFVDVDPVMSIPALLTDMVYLTWIYGTLANMLKELKELNETYKLKMYRALAWTLGAFVTLFTMLTIAMLAAEGSPDQSWEWKWTWIQVVLWEMLNFCMLVAVSIIWRPSPRSAMLAYSKQLATTEMDADDAEGAQMEGIEMQGPGAGHFVIGDDGDESDDERPKGGKDADVGAGKNGNVYSMANFEPQRNTDLA
ncbi:unnamed protein product [Ascophyllum nodosum]